MSAALGVCVLHVSGVALFDWEMRSPSVLSSIGYFNLQGLPCPLQISCVCLETSGLLKLQTITHTHTHTCHPNPKRQPHHLWLHYHFSYLSFAPKVHACTHDNNTHTHAHTHTHVRHAGPSKTRRSAPSSETASPSCPVMSPPLWCSTSWHLASQMGVRTYAAEQLQLRCWHMW